MVMDEAVCPSLGSRLAPGTHTQLLNVSIPRCPPVLLFISRSIDSVLRRAQNIPFLHSFISHYWLVCLCVCVFVHKRLRVWVYMTRQSRWCAANPLQLVSSTEEDPSMNPLMFMSLYMQNTLKCKLVKVSHFARSYKSDDVTSSQCHLFSTACFSYSWASNRQQNQSHKWEFPYTRFKMNVLPTASGLRKLTSHEYFFSCIFAENNGGQCVTRGKSLNVKCYL